MKVGDVVGAVVERIEGYGIYLRHGKEAILVLVPELAWTPTPQPAKEFAVGDELQVRILRHVPEEGRYIGSVRAASMKGSPYRKLAEAPVGKLFLARVQGLFGNMVLVELTDPIALGQLLADRIPPGLKAGDRVEVVVSTVDVEESKAVFEIVRQLTD